MQLKIKELMKEKNISFRILSQKTGISSDRLCQIANGKTNSTLRSFEKIAKGLDVKVQDLFK